MHLPQIMDIILLLIANKENRRLLTDLLGQKYQVKLCESLEELSGDFDLLVIDGLGLKQCQRELKERINREKPLFLPILFLTNRQDVKITTLNLWEIVNDLVVIPVTKSELQARVENLLRSRRLSLELQRTCYNLLQSEREVQQLQDELERLNQLFSEK